MKLENLTKRVPNVIIICGAIICIMFLFPQVRQLLIGIGENVLGRPLNYIFLWHVRIITVALSFLFLSTVYFLLFSVKIAIPQIPPEKKVRLFSVIEITLICLYSCMLIFLAFSNNSIWLDEAFSLAKIQHSWGDLIYFCIIDVHPPFYYIVLKIGSLVFGSSIAVMRMVSVFPTILMVILVCIFLKKEFSDKAALIFLLSCIASGTITRYAIEIRMYSWALFFVTMMAVTAWYFFKTGKKRWWAALLLCALGAAYTHYYAMIAAAIGYILLFLYALKFRKERIVPMVVLGISGIVLYLPWLPILIRQFSIVSADYWIPPLTVGAVLGYVHIVFSTGNIFLDVLWCLIFCSVLIYFFTKKRKTEKDYFVFSGLCCAVLLVLSGIIVSIAIRPLFVARYLVPVLGLVWLFFAVECCKIFRKRSFIFLLIIFASFGLVSFGESAHREMEEHRASSVFYTYITEHKRQDDIFVFVGCVKHLPFTMNHIFPEQTYTVTVTGEKIAPSASITHSLLIDYRLWRNSYIEYDPGIYDDKTVWTFISRYDYEAQFDNIVPLELRGEYRGSFRWNVYRFRLYRSSPMACLY